MPVKPQKPKSIMLVDDNNVALFVCRKIVEKDNSFGEILTFQNPLEALSYLQQAAISGNTFPDMILLDIQMPELNGFEFLEAFRKLPGSFQNYCTIAILTSSYDESDIKKALEDQSVHTLLKKPLTLESFTALLHEVYPQHR